jgi:lactam utilization protein B
MSLNHIKPHASLYGMAARDPEMAHAICDAADAFKAPLLGMIGTEHEWIYPITLGADKAYDAEDFVNELRSMNATPHVAQNTSSRSSAIDGRTARHAGCAMSQRIRKRIEEAFG